MRRRLKTIPWGQFEDVSKRGSFFNNCLSRWISSGQSNMALAAMSSLSPYLSSQNLLHCSALLQQLTFRRLTMPPLMVTHGAGGSQYHIHHSHFTFIQGIQGEWIPPVEFFIGNLQKFSFLWKATSADARLPPPDKQSDEEWAVDKPARLIFCICQSICQSEPKYCPVQWAGANPRAHGLLKNMFAITQILLQETATLPEARYQVVFGSSWIKWT